MDIAQPHDRDRLGNVRNVGYNVAGNQSCPATTLTIVLFLVGTAISIAGTAMSAAGWKDRFFIDSLFFVAGIFLVAGVAWPAIKNIRQP